MKNIIYTTICLLVSIHLTAQTPGYMGKRFSIEGDINILPRFTNALLGAQSRDVITSHSTPNYTFYDRSESTIYDSNPIKLNLKSSISLNYSISEHADLSFRYTHIRNNFTFNNRNHYNESYYSSINSNVPYRMNVYDFNFKLYKGQHIAPVGPYVLVGFGLANVSTLKDGFELEYLIEPDQSYYENYEHGIKTVNESVSFLKFNIGFYNKKVAKNNLYLLYGFEFNHYLLGKNDIILRDLLEVTVSNLNASIRNEFRYNVSQYVFWDNLLNFKIGVGVIL